MKDAAQTNHACRRPLVVVAGQVPPPTGGQNVMVAQLIAELGSDSRFRTKHLAFGFTPDFAKVRLPRFSKLVELAKVYWRSLSILACQGRADLLIYPSGGPETVPVVRDIFLLPVMRIISKKICVQFHAAGVAERLETRKGLLEIALLRAYRSVDSAIVMTDFNRRDPRSLNIDDVKVIPHRLTDENSLASAPDFNARPLCILYAGHLCAQKGIPQLLEAFAKVNGQHRDSILVLTGEFIPPFDAEACRRLISQLGISERVQITGFLTGRDKADQFNRAHFFVFPTIAPYESFGLVMAEAMMWGLPLVVSNWRGNREVAGPEAEIFEIGPLMIENMATALLRLVKQPETWAEKSKMSRRRFHRLYRRVGPVYPDVVADLLRSESSK